MPQTRKFSQFEDGGALQDGDIVVGLRDGVNTFFDFSGSLAPVDADYILGTANPLLPNAQVLGNLTEGIVYNTPAAGTGTFSILNIGANLALDTATNTLSASSGGGTTITQVGHGFAVEDVVRFNGTDYVLAQANTAANAEVAGIITGVNGNDITIQQSGYVDGLFSGLTPGTVYFLSSSVAGLLTATEPTTIGDVSKPMFLATSATSGWILHYRGLVVTSSSSGGGGGGGGQLPDPLQIIQDNETGTFNTTSSGWQDTGISASITTSTAMAKVAIFCALTFAGDGASGFAYRLVRDATPIDIGDADGVKTNLTQASGASFSTSLAADSGLTTPEIYIDSPGAAAAYTYKIQIFRGASSEVFMNQGATDSDTANFYRSSSNMMLWEIDA